MKSHWFRWKLGPYSSMSFFCFLSQIRNDLTPHKYGNIIENSLLNQSPYWSPTWIFQEFPSNFGFFRNNFEAMGPPSPRALRGASEPSHHPPSASRSHLSLKLATKLAGEFFFLWLRHVKFKSKMVKSWVHSWHITWNFGVFMHTYNTIQYKHNKPYHTYHTCHTYHTYHYTNKTLTQRSFYKQKLVCKETFTNRNFFTQRTFYTEAFTHRNFYTKNLYTEKFLPTEAFTYRSFYAKRLLYREVFTHLSSCLIFHDHSPSVTFISLFSCSFGQLPPSFSFHVARCSVRPRFALAPSAAKQTKRERRNK